MKKIVWMVALCTALAGCDKGGDDFSDYPQQILGTWIAVSIDGEILPTDDRFVNSFRPDGTEIFAGQLVEDENAEWIEETPTPYRVEGNILYEEWLDADGRQVSAKTRISIRGEMIICRELETFYDGVKQPGQATYTMRKVSVDYHSQFVGIWKGHETTPGVVSAHDVYWEYLTDGSYNYYYYDESLGGYVLKADNNGRYFLYGDLLASNYTNDMQTGIPGRASECWHIAIDGNRMTWSGLRENQKIVTFGMDKVSAPPVLVNP